MPLYDHRGVALAPAALRSEHAKPAQRGARAWTFASVASGLTPSRLAALFTAADAGDTAELLTLATEIERRDSHAGAQLRTRKLALAALPWQVEAATDDEAEKAIAAEVQAIIDRPEFTFLIIDLMDAVMKGYAVAEIEWTRGAKYTPSRFSWRDQRHFALDKEDGSTLRLRTEAQPREGEDMPAFKFITHLPRLASGPVATAGLVRPCAVMYAVKTLGVGAWLAYMEIFGVPTRLGKYQPGASEDDIDALERAVQMIGIDGAGVMPATTAIELLDAIGRGNSAGEHERLAKWADEQVSKAVLGQTMTADSGASLSQAQVHQMVRRDILLADALALAATLQRDLVRVYIDINYGPREVYPRIRCVTEEPEDRKAFVESLVPLIDRGLRVEQSVVRDKMGLPEPDEGAEDDAFMRPLGKAPGEPAVAEHVPPPPAKPAANARRALADEGDTDDFIDAESDPSETAEAPLVDAVTRVAKASETFAGFLASLADEEVDADALVKELALRTLQARGMGDATDEVT